MAFSLSLRRGSSLFRYIRSSAVAVKSLNGRSLHATSRVLGPGSSVLEAASTRVTQLSKDPGNEAKLKLYALYKQATIGPCNKDKPGMFDLVGRAKWDAWNKLGSMDQEEATRQYCATVEDLMSADQQSSSAATDPSSGGSYQDIVVSDSGGARTILLNRPHKYNAITLQMYREIQEALQAAGEDEAVVCAVLTGAGDYYCSGNDLSNFANIPPEGPQKMAAEAKDILRYFI
jgi:peroxisomal 3,2-trans-enoyl-CoA isomerase